MASLDSSSPPVVSEVFDEWLRVELSHAKYSSHSGHWGRAVIRSIDLDDSIMLYRSLTTHHEPDGTATSTDRLIADRIDTQVDCLGYAEYLWTASIHRFLGDTALHLAIRQRKMRCVHMLILLKGDVHIKNAVDETADMMVSALLRTTVRMLHFEAVRFILSNTQAKDIGRFPDMKHLRFQRIEKEAWDLMKAGRIMYSAPPTTLSKADPALKRHVLSARMKHLSIHVSASGVEQDRTVVSATGNQIAPSGPPSWVQMSDAVGNQYFYNEATGESSWDKPVQSVSPLQTNIVEVSATAASIARSPAASVTPVSIGDEGVTNKHRRPRTKAKADKLSTEAASIPPGNDNDPRSSIVDQPPMEVAITAAPQPIKLSKVTTLRDEYGDRPVSKVTTLRVEVESLKQEAAARSTELALQQTMNDVKLVTALRDEIDRLNKGIEDKGREYRQALKALNDDDRQGATSTSASKMGPDVWGRNQLVDMIRLLERQKERRSRAFQRTHAPVARGLTLLDSVRANSNAQRIICHEEELLDERAAQTLDLYVSEQTVQRIQALQQLRFIDTSKLQLPHQQSMLHQNSEKEMKSNSIQPREDELPVQPASSSSAVVADWNAVQSRDITLLSTYSNLKHYNIGDDGIRALSAVLDGDCIVQHLCLAGARISSAGISSFAKVAPTIHGLRYLDLSSNAICDIGAGALSEALPKCDQLTTCILSGNRIGIVGLTLLVQWVLRSQSVSFCALQNNQLGQDELQMVEKLMDEHDYSCRTGVGGRIYQKSIGLRGVDNDSAMVEHSTSSRSSSVKKIVL